MSFDLEKLYSLLPSVYRTRDIEVARQMGLLLSEKEESDLIDLASRVESTQLSDQEAARLDELVEKQRRAMGPLKALLSVIAEQVAVVEENLDQLYDDLFIETCAEWVVPYIGELVGARGVRGFPNAKLSQRAEVANTLVYRRGKGTLSVLRQLARDVTGLNASVVEYFQLLATTQYMKHIRPENLSFASLKNAAALEAVNTPFDKVTRTVDVRHIESHRGKYNIPNVGIFLYRINSYRLSDSPAFKLDDRRYLFNALGKDTVLYNNPETEAQITHLAEPFNVPMPISRRALDLQLDRYYGIDARGKLRSILLNVDGVDVVTNLSSPPAEKISDLIEACDLSDVKDASGNITGWAHSPQDKIAIDPVLGRIAFAESKPAPASVRVTYHYGFSAEMGGGEYGREATFAIDPNPVEVPSERPTIQDALDQVSVSGGVVEVVSNDYFAESLTINIAGDAERISKIELRAADERRPVILLLNDLLIFGGENSEVTLNGFVIVGNLRVPLKDADGNENMLRRLTLRHCTLVPTATPAINSAPAWPVTPRLFIESPNTEIEIEHCIVGAIRADANARVQIKNSIVDSTDNTGIAYAGLSGNEAGATLEIENSTVIGKLHTIVMKLASNTIFHASLKANDLWAAPVWVERLQQGCVRFSFVPTGSRLPRLYRCQPMNASVAPRVRPAFTSLFFGDAGYCQLSLRSADEIRRGADDEAEMGAFHDLYEPQREANLRARLNEYLRFGLEAGIFYAS